MLVLELIKRRFNSDMANRGGHKTIKIGVVFCLRNRFRSTGLSPSAGIVDVID